MKEWDYHYNQAEDLLEKSKDVNYGMRQELFAKQALVHATLAQMMVTTSTDVEWAMRVDKLPQAG
jgi:hypothetical protein